MKDSSAYSYGCNTRNKKMTGPTESSPKRPSGTPSMTALVEMKHLDVPLTSPVTYSPVNFIRIHPDRPYTIGRSPRHCNFVFSDRRVGSQHCQVFYDSFHRKLYIVDGTLISIPQFRSQPEESGSVAKASLNGVFVNGIRVRKGAAVELTDGDQVSFACSTENSCSNPVRIGFVIHKIVFEEMQRFNNSQGPVIVSSPKGCKRIFASRANGSLSSLIPRANFLLSECRRILHSDDPISYIRTRCRYSFSNGFITNNVIRALSSDIGTSGVKRKGSIPSVVRLLMKVSETCTQLALSILWAVCKLAPDECASIAVEAGLAAKLLLVIQSGCNPVLKQRAAELLKLCSLNYTTTTFISKCKLTRTIQ